VDRARFGEAVRAASAVLDAQQDQVYNADVFVRYVAEIIREMGGSGPRVDDCAREIYDEWAACQHFHLYDDVSPTLQSLARRGLKIGLISNTHRCLTSFQQHFELEGLIAVAVSSSEHGYLKPHPSIFEAALKLAGVGAAESVMVGDSVTHDIEGARRVGMRAVLVHRSEAAPTCEDDVPVIRDLSELDELL
jgi:HAD superfamily hydrolase (TIGR01662 family)